MKNMLKMVVVMSMVLVNMSYAGDPRPAGNCLRIAAVSGSASSDDLVVRLDKSLAHRRASSRVDLLTEPRGPQEDMPLPILLAEAACIIACKGASGCASWTTKKAVLCSALSCRIGCALTGECGKCACAYCCVPAIKCAYRCCPGLLSMDR